MTATVDRPVEEAPSGGKVPLVELKNVGKSYGNITALKDISLRVHAGEVTGILGDNGAGKSTLIKIISGLHQQTDGELLVDGEPTKFNSPKEALGKGIATVYQNLAVVPLMPVWRNFFLGREIRNLRRDRPRTPDPGDGRRRRTRSTLTRATRRQALLSTPASSGLSRYQLQTLTDEVNNPPRACVFARRHRKNTCKRAHSTVPGRGFHAMA